MEKNNETQEKLNKLKEENQRMEEAIKAKQENITKLKLICMDLMKKKNVSFEDLDFSTTDDDTESLNSEYTSESDSEKAGASKEKENN